MDLIQYHDDLRKEDVPMALAGTAAVLPVVSIAGFEIVLGAAILSIHTQAPLVPEVGEPFDHRVEQWDRMERRRGRPVGRVFVRAGADTGETHPGAIGHRGHGVMVRPNAQYLDSVRRGSGRPAGAPGVQADTARGTMQHG